MPTPTCPHCESPLPPSGTTCAQCGQYVPGWLYRDGAAHGPYDWETLELLFHQGRLRPDDRVTWDPHGNWQTPAEAFSAPAPPLAPPQPAAVPVAPAAVPPVAPQPPAGAGPAAVQPAAAPRRANRWLALGPLLAVLIFLGGTALGLTLAHQGFSFVRQAADRERCAGQLKVIALGMRMYVLDYGAAPPGGNWSAALEARGVPRQTWFCPARRDRLPYPVAPHLDVHRLQAGDRALAVAADAPLAKGHGPHAGKFNVVYADGHVDQADRSPLPGGKGSVVAQLPGVLPGGLAPPRSPAAVPVPAVH
jgi:prepilin-type processing-associated H-X9-DG protein